MSIEIRNVKKVFPIMDLSMWPRAIVRPIRGALMIIQSVSTVPWKDMPLHSSNIRITKML